MLGTRYFAFGFAYGVARKLATVQGMKISSYGKDERQLLLAEKAQVIALGSAAGAAYWPMFMVLRDMPMLECRMRGIDAEKYGYESLVGRDVFMLGLFR